MYASDPAALSGGPGALPSLPRERPRRISDTLLESVGGTPLVPIRRLPAGAPFELWGKAEFLNPTGSVKDRAALGIVRAALARGDLGPDRTLVDASSGNTGLAYAFLGARVGFPVLLFVPSNANPERVARARSFGATIVATDPAEGTDGAQRAARARAADDPDRYFYADQYNNPANPGAHYAGTGPEIWEAMRGRLTHLVAGVGTGGTISGAGRFLKEQDPRIRVIGVEPVGPVHGIEGLKHLPTALRPSTYDATVVDATVRVETEDAERLRRLLGPTEGLAVGVSSGAAVAAALQIGSGAPGARIVAILPDAGHVDREGEP